MAAKKSAAYTAQTAAINEAFDKAKQAALAETKAAHEQNITAAERTAAQTGEEFIAAERSAAAQSEIARRNELQRAAAAGLNGGAREQQLLSRENTLQATLGSLRTARSAAESEANTRVEELKAAYANAIAEALAKNEQGRAEALLQEARTVEKSRAEEAKRTEQSEQTALEDRARVLAGFGNFSGYKALGYSDAEIAAMQQLWKAKNPKLARYV